MNIVEFAEEILGCKLLSFQKEFLTKCYEAYESNEKLYYIPHRGHANKWMTFVLQYIAIAYHEKYSGENEVNENDNKAPIISKEKGEL